MSPPAHHIHDADGPCVPGLFLQDGGVCLVFSYPEASEAKALRSGSNTDPAIVTSSRRAVLGQPWILLPTVVSQNPHKQQQGMKPRAPAVCSQQRVSGGTLPLNTEVPYSITRASSLARQILETLVSVDRRRMSSSHPCQVLAEPLQVLLPQCAGGKEREKKPLPVLTACAYLLHILLKLLKYLPRRFSEGGSCCLVSIMPDATR